jgi:hypothetical protein
MSQIDSRVVTDSTNSDPTVLEAETWTELVATLDGSAGGDNQIQLTGASGFLMTPGVPVRFIVSPGTSVKFVTSSSTAVRVDFLITELSYIEEMLTCVDNIGQLLSQFGQIPLNQVGIPPDLSLEKRAELRRREQLANGGSLSGPLSDSEFGG